jgi:hypothetical protein
MPAVSLTICAVPVVISARSPRLVRLFADYFRYYQPQITPEAPPVTRAPLTIELQLRRALPPRTTLIPARAELFSQTGVVNLWRETLPGGTDSISLPLITGGSSIAEQTQGSALSQTDMATSSATSSTRSCR